MATRADDHPAATISVLRRSELCRDLGRDDLQTVAQAVEPQVFHSDDVICRQEEHGDAMYIVASGRVRLTLEQDGSEYQLLEYLGRGEHFGELAVLTDGPHPATATAVMDTELLKLDRGSVHRLMLNVPGFAANLSRSLGFRLRWQTSGKRRRRKPKVVGLVHSTYRTQGLVRPLVAELIAQGNSVQVLTDRTEKWPSGGDYLVEHIPELPAGDRPLAVRNRLAQVIEHHDRVLIDLAQKELQTSLPALLTQCEEVWWLVEGRAAESGLRNLSRMLEADPRLASRTRLVWILTEEERFSPAIDTPLETPSFKVVLDDPPQPAPSRSQQHGIARLVRHLQGTRIGVALGGGGARGLAHLGVLRGLEREGISVDLLSGTSSGALMGISYAAGYPPQEAVDEFYRALTPNRFFRAMPAGRHWYLWAMFRSGAWDRMLRPFFGEARLEQFQIPLSTVATDLVAGRYIVRDRGDAIHAVLESINLPPIARPILRDGMALIDGGALNNVPANILPERGADLVVAVNVVAGLQNRFAGNTPFTPTEAMRRPGVVETLLRASEVQDYNVNAQRPGVVDLMITPDTASFEFADFSQGHALADAGEAAAAEAIAQLKQMLKNLSE